MFLYEFWQCIDWCVSYSIFFYLVNLGFFLSFMTIKILSNFLETTFWKVILYTISLIPFGIGIYLVSIWFI